MPTLPLVTLPKKSLRERSRELTRAEILAPDMQKFLGEMIPAMYEYEGIGLAATQVGRNIRACVIGKEAIDRSKRPDKTAAKRTDKDDLILINPVYKKLTKKLTKDVEGCLSVPGFYGTVKRYQEIFVQALDVHGEPIEFTAANFFARVIQHEVDHLNATLFIDRGYDLYQTEHRIKLDPEIVLDSIQKISE